MGKLFESAKFMNIVNLKDLTTALTSWSTQVTNLFNGNLRFEDNFKCQIVTVDFTSSFTDFSIPHKLNAVVNGAIDYNNQIGGFITFSSTQKPTKDHVFLQASNHGIRTILLF